MHECRVDKAHRHRHRHRDVDASYPHRSAVYTRNKKCNVVSKPNERPSQVEDARETNTRPSRPRATLNKKVLRVLFVVDSSRITYVCYARFASTTRNAPSTANTTHTRRRRRRWNARLASCRTRGSVCDTFLSRNRTTTGWMMRSMRDVQQFVRWKYARIYI